MIERNKLSTEWYSINKELINSRQATSNDLLMIIPGFSSFNLVACQSRHIKMYCNEHWMSTTYPSSCQEFASFDNLIITDEANCQEDSIAKSASLMHDCHYKDEDYCPNHSRHRTPCSSKREMANIDVSGCDRWICDSPNPKQ